MNTFVYLSQEYEVTLFHAEEEEAEQRDAEKDVQMFKAACNEIRSAMRDIHSMKKQKTVSIFVALWHLHRAANNFKLHSSSVN